jgi:hypothetical protein
MRLEILRDDMGYQTEKRIEKNNSMEQNLEENRAYIANEVVVLNAPKIDQGAVDKKVNELAMKAIGEELSDYFGYRGPFRKGFKEYLDGIKPSHEFQIPDLVGLINDKIAQELSLQVDRAMAETYIPLLTECFVGVPKEFDFRLILEKFLDESKSDDPESFEVDFEVTRKTGKSSWGSLLSEIRRYTISDDKTTFEIDLEEDQSYGRDENGVWDWRTNGKWKIKVDMREYSDEKSYEVQIGTAQVKFPATRILLQDWGNRFRLAMLIADSRVTLKETEFSTDLLRTNFML